MTEDKAVLISIMKKWMVFLIIALVIISAGFWLLSRSDFITGTLNVTVEIHTSQDIYSSNSQYFLYVDGEVKATQYYYSSSNSDLHFSVDIPVNRVHEVWVESSQGDASYKKIVQVNSKEDTDIECTIGDAAKVTVELTLANYSYSSYTYESVRLYVDGIMVDSETPHSSSVTFETYVNMGESHVFSATYNNENASETLYVDEYEMTLEMTIGN